MLKQKDAILFLDSDNYWLPGHLSTVLKTHEQTGRNIIISDRVLVDENGVTYSEHEKSFFDTNTISLFGEFARIGLLWGRYPVELSLVGDRILSQYIKTNFQDQIAYTNKATVGYSYSTISVKKVNEFKRWHAREYCLIADEFRKRFGFDVQL